MSSRQDVIAKSITFSILHSNDKRRSVLATIPAFFYAYWLTFTLLRKDLFKALRGLWDIDEDAYLSSLGVADRKARDDALKPMGDMGFSGSTFFQTHNGNYIIKSVPRRFEHQYFKTELLLPYAEYMQKQPKSCLVRITDFLQNTQFSVGSIFGLAPSHHIVMENIKHGEDEDNREGADGKWESYDLKPRYFTPERDIADGALTSQETKDKLTDDFNDTLKLTLDQSEDLKAQLQKDTAFLVKHNAVDYSLFLIRIPVTETPSSRRGPHDRSGLENWRSGIRSADGKYVYRAVILDFFFSRHSPNAHAFSGLIRSYNLIDRQGPMSITTTSPDYRDRFLKMCYKKIEVCAETETP